MNMRASAAATAFAGGLLAAAASGATTITVDLGQSSQDFTLYGLGGGYFDVGQGAGTSNGATSTFTLSGAITGGSPGYQSGTYALVTTYAGDDTPDAGPAAPLANTIPGYPDEFEYAYFDPSTNVTLYTYGPGGNQSIPIVVDGGFVNNLAAFSLSYVSNTCTGVSPCDQGVVGETSGSSVTGPVTGDVSVTVSSVPEPAAWATMLLGLGLAGAALRSRRQLVFGAAVKRSTTF